MAEKTELLIQTDFLLSIIIIYNWTINLKIIHHEIMRCPQNECAFVVSISMLEAGLME